MASPVQRPERFRRGQRLTEARLNPLVEAVDAIGQQFGFRQVFGSSAPLAQFILKEENGDYLTCRTYDGTDEGTVDVLIAKPFLLRRSMVDRDGKTYTYSSNSVRTSNNGSDTETQVMTPGWVVDDLIYAERVRRGTAVFVDDVPLVWLARGEGRAWAKQAE